MEAITTAVTSTVTMLTGAMSSFVGVIIENPVLLIPIGIGVLGAAAGMVRKFMPKKG